MCACVCCDKGFSSQCNHYKNHTLTSLKGEWWGGLSSDCNHLTISTPMHTFTPPKGE
jgi:hypothetical protein